MREITISEIAEDFYQVVDLLEQCANTEKDKILPQNQDLFEKTFKQYIDKYNLEDTTSRLIWYCFEEKNFNYKSCVKIIQNMFFIPVSENYLGIIRERFPLLTKEERAIVFESCYSKINKDFKYGYIKNHNSKEQHLFKNFCNINEFDKINNFNNFNNLKKEFKNISLKNRKILLLLLKSQRQIIKELNDQGFIDMLIYHESKKDKNFVVENNIFQSFMDLNGYLNDSLVLFTFWVNKYVKYLIGYKNTLIDTKIEDYILNNSNRNSNEYYKNFFYFLYNSNSNEYYVLLQKYQSLNNSIKQLYELKNICINLILRLEKLRKETNNLKIIINKGKQILYYNNPKTSIFASFHIKNETINENYLRNIETTNKHIEHQSIPSKSKKLKNVVKRTN